MTILDRALRMGEAKQFRRYAKRVEAINAWEPELELLDDEELRALAATGPVITSAGLILAGTFSVLMTLPVTFAFNIGFMVAVGILLGIIGVAALVGWDPIELNGAVLLSVAAGAVSFARGLNDTPKIVALSLVAGALDLRLSTLLVAAMIALGGIFNARAVAQTVSKRITGMEPVHGLWANLVTSVLVIFASRWGMPVSTTHVSCGALFGIGIANGQARWKMIRTILMAWLLTLPLAALLSASVFVVFRQL